uniref:Tissue factor n=1 Tax=Neogobius melanostomus TaxID=47308 RepID=A0A8C6UK61_9GOBI
DPEPPQAEDVHWVSVDFKTVLHWSVPPSDYTYTVSYSEFLVHVTTASIVKLITKHSLFSRTFTADVVTEGIGNFDPEDFHTPAPLLQPLQLSAVSLTILKVAERSVTLNISDPLTGIHVQNKQLTIRDVLKKDLKYTVSYHKSASTRTKYMVVDSNLPLIPNLDPGQSYCFMVAALVRAVTHLPAGVVESTDLHLGLQHPGRRLMSHTHKKSQNFPYFW